MKNVKILIIKGHGGNDDGAVSGNLVEKTMNSITATAMYNFLKAQGFTNVTLDNENTEVNDEVIMANSGNYEFVISVHYNAGGGDGFECFYYSSNSKAKLLCKKIESRIKEIGQNSRGVKTGDGYKIINKVTPMSIILEGGFIDNNIDKQLFDTQSKQEQLGIAYAKGLMDYLGVNISNGNEGATGKLYKVQVGAFSQLSNANKLLNELKEKGYNAYIKYE